MRKKRLTAFVLTFVLIFAFAVCSATTALAAGADANYPSKTITIFNSSAAGSPADILARELAQAIEGITDATVVVESAPGGSGGVMFGSVMSKPADGYTWGCITAAQITALHAGLSKQFPIETFEFVSNIQTDMFALNVLTDSPWNNMADMVAWAKQNPGKLMLGGQGVGSGIHLAGLKFAKDAGIDIVYMPYEGASETARNILGGHIQTGFMGPTAAKEYVEAKQVKMFAVTGYKRSGLYPDVPTLAELGYDVPFTQYRGIFVKKGTDPAVVQAISDLIRKATLTESFVEYMKSNSLDDAYMPNKEFTEFVMKDFAQVEALSNELLKK